jgi:hypothetical protein
LPVLFVFWVVCGFACAAVQVDAESSGEFEAAVEAAVEAEGCEFVFCLFFFFVVCLFAG